MRAIISGGLCILSMCSLANAQTLATSGIVGEWCQTNSRAVFRIESGDGFIDRYPASGDKYTQKIIAYTQITPTRFKIRTQMAPPHMFDDTIYELDGEKFRTIDRRTGSGAIVIENGRITYGNKNETASLERCPASTVASAKPETSLPKPQNAYDVSGVKLGTKLPGPYTFISGWNEGEVSNEKRCPGGNIAGCVIIFRSGAHMGSSAGIILMARLEGYSDGSVKFRENGVQQLLIKYGPPTTKMDRGGDTILLWGVTPEAVRAVPSDFNIQSLSGAIIDRKVSAINSQVIVAEVTGPPGPGPVTFWIDVIDLAALRVNHDIFVQAVSQQRSRAFQQEQQNLPRPKF